MNKYLSEKNMTTIVIVVFVLIILLFLYRRVKERTIQKKYDVDTGKDKQNNGTSGTVETIKSYFPLKRGDGFSNMVINRYVRNIQKYLNKKGGNLVVDGLFGEETENALYSIERMTYANYNFYMNDVLKNV